MRAAAPAPNVWRLYFPCLSVDGVDAPSASDTKQATREEAARSLRPFVLNSPFLEDVMAEDILQRDFALPVAWSTLSCGDSAPFGHACGCTCCLCSLPMCERLDCLAYTAHEEVLNPHP